MKLAQAPAPNSALEHALARLDDAHDSLLGLSNSVFSDVLSALPSVLAKEDAAAAACAPGVGGHCASTPWGVKASQGARPNMEDAYSVQTAQPSAAGVGPVSDSSSATMTAEVTDNSNAGTCNQQLDRAQQHGVVDTEQPHDAVPAVPGGGGDLALLSVFDGHGGQEVAMHCRDRLHHHFTTHLSSYRGGQEVSPGEGLATPELLAACTTSAGQPLLYNPDHVVEALRAAFCMTDDELAGTEAGDFVGATAVVAVVGRQHIWIAHCGDSRAVIQRAGEAHALTSDHKPDREDEAARIKAAGGRVVFSSGSHRVMGMLAMSRAIGDHFLRPYVIAEPEVACMERTLQDEVLVLATDGLWDVFSCKEATNLAQRCITRSKERGMSRHGACRVAASVLTKVALERGSRDNITVIVVDVTLPPPTAVHAHAHHHHHPQHHHAAAPTAQTQPGQLRSHSSEGSALTLRNSSTHATCCVPLKTPHTSAAADGGGNGSVGTRSQQHQEQKTSSGSIGGDGGGEDDDMCAHSVVITTPAHDAGGAKQAGQLGATANAAAANSVTNSGGGGGGDIAGAPPTLQQPVATPAAAAKQAQQQQQALLGHGGASGGHSQQQQQQGATASRQDSGSSRGTGGAAAAAVAGSSAAGVLSSKSAPAPGAMAKSGGAYSGSGKLVGAGKLVSHMEGAAGGGVHSVATGGGELGTAGGSGREAVRASSVGASGVAAQGSVGSSAGGGPGMVSRTPSFSVSACTVVRGQHSTGNGGAPAGSGSVSLRASTNSIAVADILAESGAARGGSGAGGMPRQHSAPSKSSPDLAALGRAVARTMTSLQEGDSDADVSNPDTRAHTTRALTPEPMTSLTSNTPLSPTPGHPNATAAVTPVAVSMPESAAPALPSLARKSAAAGVGMGASPRLSTELYAAQGGVGGGAGGGGKRSVRVSVARRPSTGAPPPPLAAAVTTPATAAPQADTTVPGPLSQ